MRRPLALLATLWAFSACGGSDGDGPGGDGGGGDDGGSGGGDAAPPAAVCDAPPLADVSAPDHVVGEGSPQSCAEAALASAAAAGGVIVFDCGPDPVIISVTSVVTVTEETVLDGGGLVTLGGNDSTRLLYLDSAYDQEGPRLTVQRMSFRSGGSPEGGDDTAQGGGAIYRDGGSLTVIDCTFRDNHAPSPGQDIAGGAIYGFGGGETVVAGSTFIDNAASDGGAIGSLNSDLTVVNSLFDGNAASGTGGNPGMGGAGGAIYIDGGGEATTLCGVTIRNSTAGAIGGGVFRVSNDGTGTFAMDRSTVDHNRVSAIAADEGNAGGLYLQGLDLAITASTISRNEAFYNGGIWINQCQVEMTNTTIALNYATSNGGGVWLGNGPTGRLRNVTIADNHATGESVVAGAIFGEGLTLENTLIAGNTAAYRPGCDVTHEAAGGNLEWQEGVDCTGSPLIPEPARGALGDGGDDMDVMVPAAGSPAAGIATDCPETDQLGDPRPEPCTAGAVEAAN